MTGQTWNRADVAASFQQAVVDSLVDTAMRGVHDFGVKKFAIAGGVAANSRIRRDMQTAADRLGVAANSALRAAMRDACAKAGVDFYYPSPVYCTDNAAMIATAGYYEFLSGNRSGWDLNAVPNLALGER